MSLSLPEQLNNLCYHRCPGNRHKTSCMSPRQMPLLISTSCTREAATICPRPGLQVVTRYTSYTHPSLGLTRCPCWPASTANQSGLVTLTFDLLTLKVVSESRVTWATSVPILVFLGLLVLDLGPMYATDRRQTASSLNAPWAGHNKGYP